MLLVVKIDVGALAAKKMRMRAFCGADWSLSMSFAGSFSSASHAPLSPVRACSPATSMIWTCRSWTARRKIQSFCCALTCSSV